MFVACLTRSRCDSEQIELTSLSSGLFVLPKALALYANSRPPFLACRSYTVSLATLTWHVGNILRRVGRHTSNLLDDIQGVYRKSRIFAWPHVQRDRTFHLQVVIDRRRIVNKILKVPEWITKLIRFNYFEIEIGYVKLVSKVCFDF